MRAWIPFALGAALAGPAGAQNWAPEAPRGWAVGAGLAFAVGKPLDDQGDRPGSASAGVLDLRVGRQLGDHVGLHLRGAGLLGRGHTGDYGLAAGTATLEVSVRPWLLTQGPIVLRGGVGLGGARLSPDAEVDEDARFEAHALGLALSAGVTYELGWADGLLAPSGWTLGPSVDVTHLPALGGDARLTWVSVGLTGAWYGG